MSLSSFSLLLFPFFILPIHTWTKVDFDLQNQLVLEYEDYVHGEVILAEIEEMEQNEDLLAICTQVPSQFSIATLGELHTKDEDSTFNHHISASRQKIYVLSEPNQFLAYQINEDTSFMLQLEYHLDEGQADSLFSSKFINMLYDESFDTVFFVNSQNISCFDVSNENLVKFYDRIADITKKDQDEITSVLLDRNFLVLTLQKSGIVVLRNLGSCQLEKVSNFGPSFFNLESVDLVDVAVHPTKDLFLVADAGQDKVYMFQANQDMDSLIMVNHTLGIQGIQRVLFSVSSLFLVGKNAVGTKNLIMEYQLNSSEQITSLSSFSLAREYSISSRPLDYLIDEQLFYIVVENLIFLIRHSVPKELVNDNLNLISKQTWEGITQLVALKNGSIIVHSHEASAVGHINHTQPQLLCPANSFLEENNYPLKLYVVAFNCLNSTTGDTKNVCSQNLHLFVKAYVPFLSNPKLAFLVGVIIGVTILFLLSTCYCYYYCKLRKDYDVLKEQSMTMFQYKYDSPDVQKAPTGNVLGEEHHLREL